MCSSRSSLDSLQRVLEGKCVRGQAADTIILVLGVAFPPSVLLTVLPEANTGRAALHFTPTPFRRCSKR
jgi:hypothetical protein